MKVGGASYQKYVALLLCSLGPYYCTQQKSLREARLLEVRPSIPVFSIINILVSLIGLPLFIFYFHNQNPEKVQVVAICLSPLHYLHDFVAQMGNHSSTMRKMFHLLRKFA